MPPVWREAGSKKTRQPGISTEAPHLLAEWHWEANEKHGWHLEQVTLGSNKKVQWVVHDECKLGLVHRSQASLGWLPIPIWQGSCPEAAGLWGLSVKQRPDPLTCDLAIPPTGMLEKARWLAVAAED
eukprot:jgi/Astpho2/4210/Aster-05174